MYVLIRPKGRFSNFFAAREGRAPHEDASGITWSSAKAKDHQRAIWLGRSDVHVARSLINSAISGLPNGIQEKDCPRAAPSVVQRKTPLATGLERV